MSSLGSEVNIDLSTSCTKQQAVMKLLGWSKDMFTSTQIQAPETGLWLDQLPSISHHTLNLEDELKQLHETARQEYLQAFPSEAFTADFDPEKHIESVDVFEKLIEKQEALEEVKALIVRARNFAMDIDEELDKGEHSLLRTDTAATQKSGVTHITLRSLERWKDAFYAEQSKAATELVVQPSALGDPDLMAQLSKAIPKYKRDLGKSDASVYVTLGLAVEAIAEKLGGKFAREDETPVISQIAELIAGKYHSKDGRALIYGQGYERIRDRLELAMKLKPDLPKQP